MNPVTGGSLFDPYSITITILVLAVVYTLVRHRKHASMHAHDNPILASEGMLGAKGLQSMHKGHMSGFAYNLLTNDSGRVMYYIQLGHNSKLHLIAYGDKSDVSSVTESYISSRWLEPASLEGDFPKYFHMYCNPDAQSEIREVFAPDVMAQFVDFCRAYDFELFHDALYVSRAWKAVDENDTTTLATDLEKFLRDNANVLARLQRIPVV